MNISAVYEFMPRRALAPGLHMGLSVLLDVQESEYYCTGSESVGFKVGTLVRHSLGERIDIKSINEFCYMNEFKREPF